MEARRAPDAPLPRLGEYRAAGITGCYLGPDEQHTSAITCSLARRRFVRGGGATTGTPCLGPLGPAGRVRRRPTRKAAIGADLA